MKRKKIGVCALCGERREVCFKQWRMPYAKFATEQLLCVDAGACLNQQAKQRKLIYDDTLQRAAAAIQTKLGRERIAKSIAAALQTKEGHKSFCDLLGILNNALRGARRTW